ncbi:hypothetical protein CVM73_38605 [Bradyrhizobium forestalis]|uniref:Uncharacterized protein n=1 Tax=Bradyrhizobium forestalis TaxID=1419263 RepID=A0A2M8QWS5_9BRAD|nr:hypothetical protein CVM73_38605 [Bradyrhizobium forestalis]
MICMTRIQHHLHRRFDIFAYTRGAAAFSSTTKPIFSLATELFSDQARRALHGIAGQSSAFLPARAIRERGDLRPLRPAQEREMLVLDIPQPNIAAQGRIGTSLLAIICICHR